MRRPKVGVASGLALSIAGLNVYMACSEPSMLAALQANYRDFPVETGDIQFFGQVKVGHKRANPANFTPVVRFTGSVMEFLSPDFSGDIDMHTRRGELSLAVTNPLDGIDYYIRCIYALLAFHAGGMMFHAAGIVHKDRAYLFFGHSGSGKTTVSSLSKDETVLNDDLLLLLPGSDGWTAYATPFWNPSQVRPTRHQATIAGLYRLVQAKQVWLEKMSRGQALAEIISNIPVIPEDPQRSDELLARGSALLQAVPAYRLYFLPEPSFWKVVDPD